MRKTSQARFGKLDISPIERRYLPCETVLGHVLIGVTLLASVMLGWDVGQRFLARLHDSTPWSSIEQGIFIGIVYFMIFGNLVYQCARLGYIQRRRRHQLVTRDTLDTFYDTPAPPVAVLIPSYKEEPRVIRQALMSTALQAYPNRRVVLLIDDPPRPTDPDARAALHAARRLPHEIKALLRQPDERLQAARTAFLDRQNSGSLDLAAETQQLARLYDEVAAWYEKQADGYAIEDHTDALFVRTVLRAPGRTYRNKARDLEARTSQGHLLTASEVAREYCRLSTLFHVELCHFERKRYVNLSHQPNKAMNLNSYIALLGKWCREVVRPDGLHLEPTRPDEGQMRFPDATYLITLDADSILLPDYALRLVHIMEQPGNEKLAVVQTPYSAVPGAPDVLERVAGLTTDIQYLIHQGFTHVGATFWVGANALLRKAALLDIRTLEAERGFCVAKYIQDHTLIEDTESSVDLIERGWELFNYPERLSYSATPPDFGALLIQRRRWANGGLLILPKLLRYVSRQLHRPGIVAESLMRLHYLTSIAGVNIGLLLLLVYPFEDSMRSPWLPLTAIPYFVLYTRDLYQRGYPIGDVLRAYALNVMLLPINLAGVCQSLRQAVTGRKVPFGRTPKIRRRTVVPAFYLVAEYTLMLLCILFYGIDLSAERWLHALFAAGNACVLLYAHMYFIEGSTGIDDLRLEGVMRFVSRTLNRKYGAKSILHGRR